jgi:uncharacterized membrane protein
MDQSKLPLAFILLLLVDSIWLLTGGIYARQIAEQIQGKPVRIRYISAFITYAALSYLVLQTKSATHAFALGAATYAVYDFTTHAILQDYDWRFAIADTLWGGILFTLVHLALRSF